MWNTKEKPRYREIKEGLTVVTKKEIINGDIVIPKDSVGKIVYAKNQVEADIWFFDTWKYKECLNVDTDFFKPTQFRGIVLTLKGTDFAVKYRYDLHSEICFDKDRVNDIPYFDLDRTPSHESNFYRNGEKIREYYLNDIIENIDENFAKQVVNTLDQRPATEDDLGELDYVFTDEALEIFYTEQGKILEAFMKCTDMWFNFLGGAIKG